MDPYKTCNFRVEIDGIIQAGFKECNTINIKVDVVEYREGGDKNTRKLPGKVTYDPITLKWGATNSTELFEWQKKVIDGKIERKNGSIIILDDDQVKEITRWNFFNAWPSVFTIPTLNSDKVGEVAIESLTLVCERIEKG